MKIKKSLVFCTLGTENLGIYLTIVRISISSKVLHTLEILNYFFFHFMCRANTLPTLDQTESKSELFKPFMYYIL